MSASALKPSAHVVDVLGNVIGRDQPIMRMEKALEMVSTLGEKVFSDENVVFFDPFSKAGELLLACAFLSCKAKAKSNLLDTDTIFQEIYESNRYFGLAPDERHHRLSTRTFLGNTYSHDKRFNHIIRDGHYLSEQDGTLEEERFKREFESMIEYIKSNAKNKRIVAIGNPPYQESDGGFGKSAKNIYNYFSEALVNNADISEFLLVIPSRWFGGGKGLDDFRESMMTTDHLENLRYFSRANDVFPTVDINGGICFLHYNKAYNGPTNFTDGTYTEAINFREFDIIPDDPLAFTVIRKIQSRWDGQYVGEKAWSSKPFGLRTNFFDINRSLSEKDNNAVPCLSKGKVIKYVARNKITKNEKHIDMWKVSAPKAAGGSKGKRRSTVPVNQIFMVDKGTITTETYNIIESFKTKKEAENFVAYLRTDFARYMVGLRKITQDLPPDRWNWVPYMDMSKTWTDEELFKFFKITKEEQENIKAKVKEWS